MYMQVSSPDRGGLMLVIIPIGRLGVNRAEADVVPGLIYLILAGEEACPLSRQPAKPVGWADRGGT